MTSLLKATSMKEDTKEETTMDNQDNEQNEFEQEALKHIEMYAWDQPCTQGAGTTDRTTPIGVPFFALRMKNGDIYNLGGGNSAGRMIRYQAIGRSGETRSVMTLPNNGPVQHYQLVLGNPTIRKETFGKKHHGKHDQVVIVEMKQFTSHTHNGGHVFYTNNWSQVGLTAITPLVNVLATCPDIDILNEGVFETMQGYVFTDKQKGTLDEFDLTEVMA